MLKYLTKYLIVCCPQPTSQHYYLNNTSTTPKTSPTHLYIRRKELLAEWVLGEMIVVAVLILLQCSAVQCSAAQWRVQCIAVQCILHSIVVRGASTQLNRGENVWRREKRGDVFTGERSRGSSPHATCSL